VVRVLPLNPQLTFAGAGRRRALTRPRPVERPGGSRFWNRRASRQTTRVSRFSEEKACREVPSRLAVRQTGIQGSQLGPIRGPPCADRHDELVAVVTRRGAHSLASLAASSL